MGVLLMPTLPIRRAQLGDLPVLARLDQEAFGSEAYSEMTFRQFYEIAGPLLVVAVGGGNVVGYGLALPSVLPGEVWFMSLVVAPEWRRQGVGGALMAEILRTYDSLPYSSIWLTTEPTNIAIRRLCKTFHFTEAEKNDDYFGPDRARLVMVRR